MRAYILAISLIAAPAMASQEMVAKFGNDEIRIADAPCVYAGVLQHIKPEDRKTFRKAGAVVGGKSFFACWRSVGDSIHLVYEDADQGIVPVPFFKEVPSV